ncbi:ribosomal protection-like ABC-F family protein [Mesobacillus zeae]|uniref:ABC-F type ribosomal protection protein n=1 Tax=Mesobacillus zeae TaxID=1917180 RepID=A0A398BDB3_9BACI|nr:ABC-F type ribosomal protection protein [Mesobacillus zeae]RID85583.1 ABC-F type ribosomal protection protein [Mesobacillus zeae]
MLLIKINEIKKTYGNRVVLDHVSFDIQRESRIGIVGHNGSGKTTLANILAGILRADKGTIDSPSTDIKIGYLRQSMRDNDPCLPDEESMFEGEVFEHTGRLGIGKLDIWDDSRLSSLSGGEKMKVALANIWSSSPDLLILDEPTNHLDEKGIHWLVSELNKYSGAVLIISHDRYFLDQSVSSIVEIEDGKSVVWTGNYTRYHEEKAKVLEAARQEYEIQQRHKKKIEDQMANLRSWSEKAHRDSTKQGGFKEFYRVKAKKLDNQVKSKRKRLERELKQNTMQKPKEQQEIRFQFKERTRHGKRILEVNNLGKKFGKRILFSDSSFYITHGEKVGIVGDNGSGKTTLLNILLGKDQVFSGEIWLSETLKVGYLSQDADDFDGQKSALEHTGLTDRQKLTDARTAFASLGLDDAKITCPVGQLSLGERTRVKLLCMMLANADILILDEPTNHLDLSSREELEKALSSFPGTILAVSHDLYFLNRISEKLLVIENCNIKRVERGFKDYRGKQEPAPGKKEEDLLLLQNEISALLGKISLADKNSKEYIEMDKSLAQLMEQQKRIQRNN